MDQTKTWLDTLQAVQKDSFRVLALDQPVDDAALRALADEQPPPAAQAFARHWNQEKPDAWQALLQSAADVNPPVMEDGALAHSLEPLRALLSRTEYAAIVYGHASNWQSPQQWGYLVQIGPPRPKADSDHLLLHLPASLADIAAAEAALRMKLPPSYRRFLMLTNGLGIGATELTYVCGAGPARANWNAVILNQWMECSHQHEIAAAWRSFQGDYDYARIMDWEGGINSFESDETILVPFAHFAEAYCFDRMRPNTEGEYPVMFWDHELRGASETHPDFLAWFAEEVESYMFGLG